MTKNICRVNSLVKGDLFLLDGLLRIVYEIEGGYLKHKTVIGKSKNKLYANSKQLVEVIRKSNKTNQP